MASQLDIVINAINKASGPIGAVEDSLGSLKDATGDLISNGLSPLSNILENGLKIAAGAAIGAIGGIVALGGKGIQLAAGFEQTQVAFETMLGSAEKAKDLMAQLFKFSASTPFQFEEVSAAAKQLISFGVGASDVQDTLKRLGDVASGVGAPLGDISLIYGKIMSTGKVSGDTLMQMGERGIPIISALAKTMGVAKDQVAGLVSKGKVGFPEFQKALASMTDSGGQFSGMMEKQSLTLNGLFSSLKDNVELTLAKVGASLIKNLDLKDIMAKAIEWTGSWGDKLGQLADTYIPMVIDRVKVFASQWLPVLIQKFNEWWAIGSNLIAQIPALVNYVTSLINSVRAMLQPAIDFISRFVSMQDVIKGLQIVLAGIVAGAIASFIAVWGPVAVVVGGAIAIVSLLRNEWQNNFLGIQTLVANVTNYLQDRFHLLWDFIKVFGAGALQEIVLWVTGNQTQFTNLSHIWDQIRLTARVVFSDLVNYIRAALPEWISVLTGWGAAAWQWIVSVAPIVTAKLLEWGNAVLGFVTAHLPQWIAQLSAWGNAAWQWLVGVMPLVTAKLAEWGVVLYNWLIANLPTWLARLGEWGTAIWRWIVDATPFVVAKLGEWANSLYLWVAANLPAWVARVTAWGTALWQWIVDATPGAITKLGEWATGLFNWVVARLPSWLATFMTWQTAMWKWIGDAIPQAINKLTEWVNDMSSWASTGAGNSQLLAMFGTMATTMLTALGNIGLALAKLALVVAINLITALAQGLLNWAGMDVSFGQMKDHAVSAIMGWVPSFSGAASAVMGAMREGFLSAQNAVRNGLDIVMDFVQQGRDARMGPFAQSLYDGGNNALQRMGQGFAAARGFAVDQFNQVMTDVNNQGIAFAGGALAGRLLQAGSDLITKFGTGFAQAAPGLTASINSVFGGVRDGFNYWHDTLAPHFLGSAKDLFGKIAMGAAGINLSGAVDSAFVTLRDAFNHWHDDLMPHFFSAMQGLGGNVISGLSDGIRRGIGAVISAIQGITDALPQWVKDQLGIHSPSTVFAGLGQNIIQGLVQGMQNMAAQPRLAMAGVTDSLQAALGNVQLGGAGGNNSSVSNNQNTTHNWNVNVPTSGGDAPQSQMQSLFNTLTNVYAS